MAFGDIIQSKTNDDNSASSIAVTLDSTPTEGNLLLACHFTGDSNSIAPSGFSEAVALTDGGNADQGAIYYKVAGSGESTTITCTSDSSDEHMLAVHEIEGPWNASPLDQTASSGPTSSTETISSGTTGTTSQADEFAIVLFTARTFAETYSGLTNSFTMQVNTIDTSNKLLGTATRLLTATGTYETTGDLNWSTTQMGGIATFKKQAAGGGLSIPVAMRYYRNMRT